MSCRFVGVVCATLIVAMAGGGDPAFARTKRSRVETAAQMLFRCHIDRLLTLRASSDGGADKSYAVTGRRTVSGEVSLTIDAGAGAMTLHVQFGGGASRAYRLSDVEQGNSVGSGAGGRADTTIRGRSGNKIFTLFAGYDNNGADHEASLQVEGRNSFLLGCDDDPYQSGAAKGVGRFGSTNIYGLSADGLAKDMKELPAEPAG